MKTIDILIVEDLESYAQAMEILLLQHPDIKTVCYCNNMNETLEILKNNKVGILMLDLNLGTKEYDGTTIARKVKERYSETRIMIFSENIRAFLYFDFIKPYSIEAYIDKMSSKSEIFKAIDELQKGNCYLDENIRSIINIQKWMKVTKRQKEVLGLSTEGLVNKQIAERLFISVKTVENHLAKLREIFSAKTTSELIKLYIEYKTGNREDSANRIPPFKSL